MVAKPSSNYIGRLAPSPTGYLHLGHARTFWLAAERTRQAGGRLLLRFDDLDRDRCRPEFVAAARADLAWLGLQWEEPAIVQSDRLTLYRQTLAQLHALRLIFPCEHSRRDVREATGAPHEDDDEPVYPKAFRPAADAPLPPLGEVIHTNWRFRVPDDETLTFEDGNLGRQSAMSGRDFGDFLVWRRDNLPSYQLACVADDIAVGITEVVRGADLIRSTFRQLLLFRALGQTPPRFYHCDLMRDEQGRRLAKRHDALSLRAMSAQGVTPTDMIRTFTASP
ncbi:MAG: tRNA glutamyl-Q(34) synthetase GluQRS [Opitutaceae bacterium]|nr:tRNA glutamyl-Q(34) synthetase GluQRS [Opitutaceae bacterium]